MIRSYRTCLLAVALAGFIALPATVMAAQKTAKQCNDEWTANKAQLQAAGTKKKDFVAQCRTQEATAAPAGAAATGEKSATPPATAATPPPHTTPAAPSGTTARPGAATAAGAGQFATEAQAKAHCPGDTVVWANLDSKIYHYSTNRNYGNTKSGTYMCERDTAGAGVRAPKNEKHP
jgi:hypothetical protein